MSLHSSLRQHKAPTGYGGINSHPMQRLASVRKRANQKEYGPRNIDERVARILQPAVVVTQRQAVYVPPPSRSTRLDYDMHCVDCRAGSEHSRHYYG